MRILKTIEFYDIFVIIVVLIQQIIYFKKSNLAIMSHVKMSLLELFK